MHLSNISCVAIGKSLAIIGTTNAANLSIAITILEKFKGWPSPTLRPIF